MSIVSRRALRAVASATNVRRQSIVVRHCVSQFQTRAATTADTTASSASASASTPEKDEYVPMSWTKFVSYISGGVCGLTFAIYFKGADYDLHRTEKAFLESYLKMPFYAAPGPTLAERNTRITIKGVPDNLAALFAEWFMVFDLRDSEGVSREDVLDLCAEMGLIDEAAGGSSSCKASQTFLARGGAVSEERQRLAGAGLQESADLLGELLLKRPSFEARVAEALERRLGRSGDGGASSANAGKWGFGGFGAFSGRTRPPANAPSPPADTSTGASAPASWQSGVSGGLSAAGAESSIDDFDSLEDERHQLQIESARYSRIEADLVGRLERLGSLSPAEEGRLHDARERKALALAGTRDTQSGA